MALTSQLILTNKREIIIPAGTNIINCQVPDGAYKVKAVNKQTNKTFIDLHGTTHSDGWFHWILLVKDGKYYDLYADLTVTEFVSGFENSQYYYILEHL